MTKTDTMSPWAETQMKSKYAHTKPDGTKETWSEIAHRVAKSVFSAVNAPAELVSKVETAIRERKFMPGGRYLYASGNDYHQTQNCLLLRAEDSREGWCELQNKAGMALMTGAGIGVDYSDIRGEGSIIRKTGGVASGPLALMNILNETGRHYRQGGSRRSAIWAGLNWKHPDVFKFIQAKNWSDDIKALKEKDFNAWATLDGTNISVQLDDEFFEAYRDPSHPDHVHADRVYWMTVRQMLETAEPGFSVDVGENAGETLRNACTEITSRDDSDICNLGSINLARVETLEEFTELVEIATAFLIAGTVYSDVPYQKVAEIRNKNRRIGLGLMGVHEWLLVRGKKYGPDEELEKWLKCYESLSDIYAESYAREWNLSTPVKVRCQAPTGTTGIVGETTTGIEPIFCVSYKRRYKDGDSTKYQLVVDPTAKRLVESGVRPEDIEDAYTLAEVVERRVKFQAWVQEFVDHGISSTINLPSWGSALNNENTVKAFGDMLIRYLPKLRGITVYPDGARSGQPLSPVPLSDALGHEGEVFVEQVDVCDISGKGTCGGT